MTGHIIVKRLNKSGNFKSELDWDKCFIDKDNPKGYFKMVITPIENNDGVKEIKYMKVQGGYKVSGESWIITDGSEKEIDVAARRHYERNGYVMMTEVNSEEELW